MSALDLSAKIVLVTGASRGIGRAVAGRMAEMGATVFLNGRYEATLGEVASELSKRFGVECIPVAADVSEPAQIDAMFRTIFKRFKRLDAVVNNAGVLRDGLIGMIRQEDIRLSIDTNLIGIINCTQAAARLMQRERSGSIVNMSSIIGVNGNAGQLVYGASKAGVIGITRSAAKELARLGIRVNAIAPGYIKTAMISHIDPEIHRTRLESIAMGRIGEPEDVADVALFLVSDLSRYVTGQIVGVDGGMLI